MRSPIPVDMAVRSSAYESPLTMTGLGEVVRVALPS